MIPLFPQFKTVEVNDREAVEAHTHRYPPYSDFNFTSLWAWDTTDARMVSGLNDNLVVRFTDYDTGDPFLSFLGITDVEDTTRILIEYAKEHGLPQTLRLVPEASIKEIRASEFKVEEDRDNFDYVYSIPALTTFAGGAYKGRRQFVNRFVHEHPNAHVETIDFVNAGHMREPVLEVIKNWERRKEEAGKEHEVEKERISTERLFDTAPSHDLVFTSVFDGDAMIAFSIDEVLPNQFSIAHFWKADGSHAGVYDFILQKKAQHLDTLGVAFMNNEQDLGVPGLRQSKMDYRPVDFLKKYKVSLQQPQS